MANTVEASPSGRTLGRLLTIGETAERLAVSRATVYRLLDEHELPRIRVRSHLRIAEADVESLIGRRRDEGAAHEP
jgi:excisionase family DNA binding protein